MDCLLHTKEFTFEGKETPHDQMYFMMGELSKGAECNCYDIFNPLSSIFCSVITDVIACGQNPHIALYYYTEATIQDLSHLENQIRESLDLLKENKAGYVKTCGCFEFIALN